MNNGVCRSVMSSNECSAWMSGICAVEVLKVQNQTKVMSAGCGCRKRERQCAHGAAFIAWKAKVSSIKLTTLPRQGQGLIYNSCLRTKRGLKCAYATSHSKAVIYKNKLDGRMCAPVWKLWPMRTHIVEAGETGDMWEASLYVYYTPAFSSFSVWAWVFSLLNQFFVLVLLWNVWGCGTQHEELSRGCSTMGRE